MQSTHKSGVFLNITSDFTKYIIMLYDTIYKRHPQVLLFLFRELSMKKNLLKNVVSAVLIVVMAALAGCAGGGGRNRPAGEEAGKPFPELKLLYNTSEGHKKIAETIKQMWKKELGITVQLDNVEWKTYLKNLQVLDYDIARAGWIGDYNDPNTFLDMFLSYGGNNQTGWKNAQYDALIESAASELDPNKRMAILAEAEDILINKATPIMPIYFYVNQNVVKQKVKGMTYNLRDIHLLKYVWIEKDGRPAPENEQVFRFNNGAEPETLDPGLMTGSTGFNIADQIFEGLIQYDPETLAPMPCIATSWDISDDGLVYTFHLRKDAFWTNGDPVTANDFYFAWKRVLEPVTGAEYAYQIYYLKNAKAYNHKEIDDFSKVGLKVIDDYTLETTLENPTAYWLDLLAFHTLLPVNRKCVEKYGSRWTRPENIVTNGPFKLTEWKPKDRIVMEKWDAYRDAPDVKLKKIIAFSIEDNVTALNMFKADETDWIRTIPLSHTDEVRTWPESHITPFLTTYYYRFNTTHPPLDDPRVRQALNLAVDKAAICKYVLKAGQKPATTFVPPGIPGYKPPKGAEYNPEKARELLREAGFAVNIEVSP